MIGRIDPRMDREQDRLVICLLQLEPWVKLNPRLLRALRREVESFASRHGAEEVEVIHTEPKGLK
ncbi:MAG: hypothetical protein QN198_06630 [Armatimonadota bacterium]|nr:hypothetical protein [Armatimonadota bacterium]MDR5703262.1 hypothetical protein [Armatimonadota bacterium]